MSEYVRLSDDGLPACNGCGAESGENHFTDCGELSGERRALAKNLEHSRAQLQRAQEALGRLAIVELHVPAENKSTVRIGWLCKCCEADVRMDSLPGIAKPDQIRHAADCPLRPALPSTDVLVPRKLCKRLLGDSDEYPEALYELRALLASTKGGQPNGN